MSGLQGRHGYAVVLCPHWTGRSQPTGARKQGSNGFPTRNARLPRLLSREGEGASRRTGRSLLRPAGGALQPGTSGLAQARKRAEQVGLTDRSVYQQGTFTSTGLGHGAADAALSVDAIQYASDKTAVFREAYRILRPRGRLAFCAFEVDPERVAGIPVLGVDPVPDYAPLLATAGFAIDSYQESAGWADRVPATFGAVMEAMPTLTDEMGEAAAASLQMEAAPTLQLQPYRRRVIVHELRLER